MPRAQDGERLAAVIVGRAVEDEDAVKMVDLVLEDAGGEPLQLQLELVRPSASCASTRTRPSARPAR